MGQLAIETSEQIVGHQQATLLELLDRLLNKGVVVKGELLLSVADVDLVYLNVGVLLSSVKTVKSAARRSGNRDATWTPWQTFPQETSPHELLEQSPVEVERKDGVPTPFLQKHDWSANDAGETLARTLPSVVEGGLAHLLEPKANIDPKNVEKGLARLVLTLVELIRKLMEKQAVRNIDAGQLNAQEIERVGNTFFLLDERMEQLKMTFGLQDEDLNLDLGPLGELL
ncbi:MAG TPA: gas vesicle protein GvpJ [Ktedonobacteraceae bacterium]|nr:gas vesicle protein GvpJ [Ktedonobacteraceae bacterium]